MFQMSHMFIRPAVDYSATGLARGVLIRHIGGQHGIKAPEKMPPLLCTKTPILPIFDPITTYYIPPVIP